MEGSLPTSCCYAPLCQRCWCTPDNYRLGVNICLILGCDLMILCDLIVTGITVFDLSYCLYGMCFLNFNDLLINVLNLLFNHLFCLFLRKYYENRRDPCSIYTACRPRGDGFLSKLSKPTRRIFFEKIESLILNNVADRL